MNQHGHYTRLEKHYARQGKTREFEHGADDEWNYTDFFCRRE